MSKVIEISQYSSFSEHVADLLVHPEIKNIVQLSFRNTASQISQKRIFFYIVCSFETWATLELNKYLVALSNIRIIINLSIPCCYNPFCAHFSSFNLAFNMFFVHHILKALFPHVSLKFQLSVLDSNYKFPYCFHIYGINLPVFSVLLTYT